MIRLLIVGNTLGAWTALGYEASKMLKGFVQSKKFDVRYAITCGGDIKDVACYGEEIVSIMEGLKYYNMQIDRPDTCKNFDAIYQDFHPQIVLAVHDVWTIESIISSPYRKSFMLCLYATIETPEYPDVIFYPTHYNTALRKSLKKMYKSCDMIIPVTQMGKNALKKIEIESEDNIYNGIDFDKRCKKINQKEIVFNGNVKNDEFLFMAVGENNIRKRMDVIIEAFALFLKKVEKPEKYKLYLHTNLDHAYEGTDLKTMIKVLGIGDSVVMLTAPFIPTEMLYDRYSVCDCYISLSGGEGFNLPAVEAMMHKKPVIYCDYGGHAEYLKGIGMPVKIKNYYNAPHGYIKWAMADIEDAADKMIEITKKPIDKEILNKGFEFAKSCDWANIFPQIYKAVNDKFKDFEFPPVELKRMF